MKHAKHSVELLLSEDKSEATSRGRLIQMLNLRGVFWINKPQFRL